jgi:hypothetical protein
MDIATKVGYIGQWLKNHPHADQVHCILRYDEFLLVAYCGCSFPYTEAVKPLMGVRRCVDCERLRRTHLKERSAHVVARK